MTREEEIEAVKDEIVQHLRRNMGSYTARALVAKLDALQDPLPTRYELHLKFESDVKGYKGAAAMELAGEYWLRWVADQLAGGCYADLTPGARDTLMLKHAQELADR